jgi:transposase-like protein
MPISDELLDADLKFECPNCSCSIIKKGSWVKSISGFRCNKCGAKVRIGYPEKLAIFEKHQRSRTPPLARPRAGS